MNKKRTCSNHSTKSKTWQMATDSDCQSVLWSPINWMETCRSIKTTKKDAGLFWYYRSKRNINHFIFYIKAFQENWKAFLLFIWPFQKEHLLDWKQKKYIYSILIPKQQLSHYIETIHSDKAKKRHTLTSRHISQWKKYSIFVKQFDNKISITQT